MSDIQNIASDGSLGASRRRLRVAVRGAVQGVGFRPFVYRLATELGLVGWVNNSPQGVFIEVEGQGSVLDEFVRRLQSEKPPLSSIQSLETTPLEVAGFRSFEIRPSETSGEKSVVVMADMATCAECQREIFDSGNRRYLYPFTNCTHCGPRFSIIESVPYDRANTSMRGFPMCPACREEYENPRDRRYHAQPNACPVCGPQVEWWNNQGQRLKSRQEAVVEAANAIRGGAIVAVKGLGGFHLMVAAHYNDAVLRLRHLKHREVKPFALMLPTVSLARHVCHLGELEEQWLSSPEAPILLLERKDAASEKFLAPSVAPGNPYLGVMLPYTPLHHILMAELGIPVVATSGNLSDEPICIDEHEAVKRLNGIADFFLVHNRPIVRHVDDSIMRVMAGREMVMRRARGFAPLPVAVKANLAPTLAVGAHLKSSVALGIGHQVFISQHIGDLETEPAWAAFQRVAHDLPQLYDAQPVKVACDLHPDYLSTQFAVGRCGERERQRSEVRGQESAKASQSLVTSAATIIGGAEGKPELIRVQHHYAHVLSCMAEHGVEAPVLGVAWDGTGLGTDGTIWGGEFLRVTKLGFERFASLRPFRLPGGEKAVYDPRRSALGLLHEIYGESVFAMETLKTICAFKPSERAVIARMLNRNINSPVTTSMGRLFDAVASIIGLRQVCEFEGQAAMELEFAAQNIKTDAAYPVRLVDANGVILEEVSGASSGSPPEGQGISLSKTQHEAKLWSAIHVDWRPMIQDMIAECRDGMKLPVAAAKFHNTLAAAVLLIARRAGEIRVALSGGCFQNRYLAECVIHRLRAAGFVPLWHQRVPPNDGGIALGQVMAANESGSVCV